MIDIHSHILPKIDDGSKSLEETLEMLNIAKEDGTEKIIATPHYCRGYYESRAEDVYNNVEFLKEQIIKNNIDIEIIPGQEVFLDSKTIEDFEKGFIKGLGKTHYMLVEFPMDNLPKYALEVIYELKIRGMNIILAHPERYRPFIEHKYLINEFIDEQCYFQINTGSIKGIFGKEVKNTAEFFIKKGVCHFIGSDSHSSNRRKPGLRKSLEIIKDINEEIFENIKENEKLLLQDKNIPYNLQKIQKKRSFFDFFRR